MPGDLELLAAAPAAERSAAGFGRAPSTRTSTKRGDAEQEAAGGAATGGRQ